MTPRPSGRLQGDDLIGEVLRNMEEGLFRIRGKSLVPSVYRIYLNPADYEPFRYVLPFIAGEIRTALDARLAKWNRTKRRFAQTLLEKIGAGDAIEAPLSRPSQRLLDRRNLPRPRRQTPARRNRGLFRTRRAREGRIRSRFPHPPHLSQSRRPRAVRVRTAPTPPPPAAQPRAPTSRPHQQPPSIQFPPHPRPPRMTTEQNPASLRISAMWIRQGPKLSRSPRTRW